MDTDFTALTVDGFGDWFAGLVDGEGCFSISARSNHGAPESYMCQFSMTLRDDDAAVLAEAHARLGIGRVWQTAGYKSTKPATRFSVDTKPDVEVLVAILDRFKLRTKKRRDYEVWRQGVVEWLNPEREDWDRLAVLAAELRSVRAYRPLVFEGSVYGMPQTAGSKRGFVNPKSKRVMIVDDNPKSRAWKDAVAQTVGAARGDDAELLTGALAVEFVFYLPRPQGHYGSGKNAGKLRPSAPAYPIVRPDVTKLVRAAEDGLTGVLWRDDAQVVERMDKKRYGDPARVEIRVWEMSRQVIGDLPDFERARVAQGGVPKGQQQLLVA